MKLSWRAFPLSPPVSRVDPEICNGLSYSYTRPRIPWLSPSTVSPLTQRGGPPPTHKPSFCLSLYIFDYISTVHLVSYGTIVAKPWLWGGLYYGQPAYGYEAYNGTRGGKSGAAEDDVRVKWLRYRILADAICAIIPSVFNERRWIVWSCYFEIVLDRSSLRSARSEYPWISWFFVMEKLLLLENKQGSWEFFWFIFFGFLPLFSFYYFWDNNVSDVSRTRVREREISKWNFRLIFREIFSNEIPGAEIRVMGRSNSRNLFFFSGAPRRSTARRKNCQVYCIAVGSGGSQECMIK